MEKTADGEAAAPSASDPLKDLELLIRSRYGAIFLESVEEGRTTALLRHLADKLGLPMFTWSCTKGLRNMAEIEKAGSSGEIPFVYASQDPAIALGHVEEANLPAVYQFQGLGAFLEDRRVAAKLADAADQFTKGPGALILTGPDVELPPQLRPIVATLKLPPPGTPEYRDLVQQTLRDLSRRMNVGMQLTDSDLAQLFNSLRGLTLMEAGKVLTLAIVETGCLSRDAIGKALEAKKAIIEREGLLEYYPAEAAMGDIADLAGLKAWLAKRRGIITDPEGARRSGLSFPRGVLLLGVQGCGKSLCAKAVASEWALPLLKLDPSNLYNKYVGESEHNFQRAIKTAEQMAPVVLWIDEIEKAFAQGGDEDGGVSQRIFGTFLSWLQDRQGDVFVVATANNIERLPPEFIRKGRFDEIFFVDLPNEEARRAILEIHLKKRGKDPARFDIPALVRACEGFSGAEIEQAVVSALYTVFAARTELTTQALQKEIALTCPLSRTMRERIESLRDWAKERTVSAQ